MVGYVIFGDGNGPNPSLKKKTRVFQDSTPLMNSRPRQQEVSFCTISGSSPPQGHNRKGSKEKIEILKVLHLPAITCSIYNVICLHIQFILMILYECSSLMPPQDFQQSLTRHCKYDYQHNNGKPNDCPSKTCLLPQGATASTTNKAARITPAIMLTAGIQSLTTLQFLPKTS